MPGRRRSTAWCARWRRWARISTALGHDVRYATPEGRFTVPMPTYPEIRLALFPRREPRADDRRIRARRDAYRHRRHDGLERARDLPQTRHPLHDLVPHPLSRICACALSVHSERAGLSLAALVSRARHRDDGGDANPEARTGGARLSQCAHLVARRGCRAIPSHRPTRRCPFATDLALCRPRRGREEHRGVSGAGSARHQGGGRRRPGARAARTALSRRAIPGPQSPARSSSGTMRPATCSSFPAAPTRSAW